MTCGEVAKFLGVFLDGEFADEDRREVEAHVASCTACGRDAESERRLHEALRNGLRALPAETPDGMEERIVAALRQEDSARGPRRAWLVGSIAAAVAAAAAVAVWISTRTGAEEASIVEAIVESHHRDLPVEVASGDSEDVRAWFRGKVDVPVMPPRPRRPGTKLGGGRVSQVRGRPAAQLVYDLGGRRASVFIFDPKGFDLRAPRRSRVRDREVLLGSERGYNVAIFEDRGLVYGVAAEANDGEILDFVNAAFPGR